jgi:16S rRNA (cytidine1402-2'-O)-methyltransferase
MSGGQLILAATPLGNILDASERLKQTLQEADLIAAEDTRRAKRLFADLNLDV